MLETIAALWPIFTGIFLFIFGLAGWAIRIGLASKADLAKTKEELVCKIDNADKARTELIRRTDLIEMGMQHMPTGPAIVHLQLEMKGLSGEMATLSTRLQGFDDLQEELKRQVHVMDDFLRKANQ